MRVKHLNWEHVCFEGSLEVGPSHELPGFLLVEVLETLLVEVLETTNQTSGMHETFEPIVTHSNQGQRDNVTTIEKGARFLVNPANVLFMVPADPVDPLEGV